jgi:hypothetical protein
MSENCIIFVVETRKEYNYETYHAFHRNPDCEDFH